LQSPTQVLLSMLHHPRKRFGQHFLHDAGVIARIVAAICPRPGEALVEIGPGLGAISRPLLERIGRLHVVELDRDLIPELVRRCADAGELTVHQADALSFDFGSLLSSQDKLRVVGNLPYNISTPLIFHLLESWRVIEDMHFLLQREVVDRITAMPGGGAYGRLSVMVQHRCRCERLFRISNGAFTPPPKVESAFVRLTPHRQGPDAVEDERRFATVVRRAFSQRRKTLKNNLKGVLSAADIVTAGIDPNLRPEMLTVAQFAALANVRR
jgi:16S rRNA (adenine1518-N6/adenine1519-N6)-dimethyltransferase